MPSGNLFTLAAALFTAHLATALIQFDAARLADVVAGFEGGWPFPPIRLALFLIALWALVPNFWPEPGARLREWRARLALPEGRGTLFWMAVALLLPHRIMDDNSGYVFLPPEEGLYWCLLSLDLIRGGLAARMLWHLLPGPAPIWPSSTSPVRPPSRGLVAAVALGSMAVMAVIQFGPLEGLPHVDDEIVQDWQARLLATGRIRAATTPCGPSFRPDEKMGYADQVLSSTYQPGLSLIWSVFARFGAIGWTNPLLALLALGLLHRLLSATHGAGTASLAVLLLALSPFFIGMGAGRMNHVLALVLWLVAARGTVLAMDGSPTTGGLLAGLGCGLALMTRRVDAVAALLAIVVVTPTGAATRRESAWFLLVMVSALAACFGVQSAFLQAHFGSALQMVAHAGRVVAGWRTLDPTILLGNLFDNLSGFSVHAFGGILAGFLGIGWLFRRSPDPAARLTERLFLVHGCALILGYGLYFYQDFCYGPRFLFGLLPLAALGWAVGLQSLGRNGRALLFVALPFAGSLLAHQVWSNFGREFWHVDSSLQRAFSLPKEVTGPDGKSDPTTPGQGFHPDRSFAPPPEPRLLFLRHPGRIRLGIVRQLAALQMPPEEIALAAVDPALDGDALLRELSGLRRGMLPAARWMIASARNRAKGVSPTMFDISRFEVVRLNGPDLADQQTVWALDLGDEANSRLCAWLPRHTPWLVSRQGSRYACVPLAHAGLARFDEGDL